MQGLVSIKTFLSRHEAEISKGFLLDKGIETVISADDVGGHLPDFGLVSGGIKLLVRREDAERAKKILKDLKEE